MAASRISCATCIEVLRLDVKLISYDVLKMIGPVRIGLFCIRIQTQQLNMLIRSEAPDGPS